MNLPNLLKQLGEKKGLGSLSLDSSGVCRLIVNQDQLLTFERSLKEGTFYLYSSVGEINADRERELTLSALQGNLFGNETGQASLGYLPKERALVLFETFNEDQLHYPEFEKKFEEFIQYLAYWINKLKKPSAPTIEDISLDKHIRDLQQHKDLKIFFA